MQTPPSLVEDLLAARENIVTTDCVYLDEEGAPTERHCDGNSWAETDASRKYLATADPAKPLFLEYGGAFCGPACAGCIVLQRAFNNSPPPHAWSTVAHAALLTAFASLLFASMSVGTVLPKRWLV